ncbi:ketol-acid reductoisomerase [Anaplasma marginale]|uniref:ketol-acid reductoisomerase n=1 Tax=Anaplasma marginale TaxID=770 RepID=UPI00123C042F|nr:ketol-acid reductoisomerase [Anaplasma marginale]KAA8472854.1 ketol-acid reductoisomerase [Anaplasma marginale]KAB0451139.1 ketol-acid reductoisomerase [Anaplasma marginale]
MEIYQHSDCSCLSGKKFCIVGYGSQGKAQAMNLRDSGIRDITIILHAGSRSIDLARGDGFEVDTSGSSAKHADVIVMLAPDEAHREICKETLFPYLKPGQAIIFAHGLSILYGLVELPGYVDVCMVSPKSVGTEVRNQYLEGNGVVCFTAVMNDCSGTAKAVSDAYAAAVMLGKLIIGTTFKQEVEANLFSEQVVLCGGIPSLIKCAFEVMVESGISPEVAYLGCVYEVKLIADLMHRKGIYGCLSNVSSVAGYGASITGDRIIDGRVKQSMRETLAEIQSREFFKKLSKEPNLQQTLSTYYKELEKHPIEAVGKELRDLMNT